MVNAIFSGKGVSLVGGLWQYDYGQVLRIQGIKMPKAVEIQFSLSEQGGEAISRIGVTKDGVTDVTIPDGLLENNLIAEDYYIYVFIFVSDEVSGETVKKISLFVKSRPKPEAYDTPEEAEMFRNAVLAVNESAERASASEKEAERSMRESEQILTFVKSERQEAVKNITEVSKLHLARINSTGEANVTEIIEKGSSWEDKVNLAGKNQVQTVENAGTENLEALNAAGTAQVKSITDAGAENKKLVDNTGTKNVELVNAAGGTWKGTLASDTETHKKAMNTLAAEKLSDINKAGAEQAKAVNDTGTASKQAVADEAKNQIQNIENTVLSMIDESINDYIAEHPVEEKVLRSVALEKSVESYYALRRTGKLYQTKLWKCTSNPTSTGEKMLDNTGLVFEPSTDTVEGRDDYADIPLFQWVNCNYVRDSDGAPRPVAIEGMDNYKTAGAVDVGVMQPSFWWNWDTSNADYDLVTISDLPHPELGLVPWPECVKADGTVLPWCIGSKYFSGIASDGLLRSQPGLKLEVYQSHNNMFTNYHKKGAGYTGAGAERNTFQIVFNAIKGATKSSQSLYAGCTGYSFQYSAAIQRSEKDTFFPVTKSQAESVEIGSRVYVGYGGKGSNGALNTDRGLATMRAYADMAKVLKIDPIDEQYSAVYLDVKEGFDTLPVTLDGEITANITMSSMQWESGTTDIVIGSHDGSMKSNTSGKYPYRVQGREYAPGCYSVATDTVMFFKEDYSKDVYVAKKGTPRSTSDATILNTYKFVGNIPADENGADFWIGDVAVDPETGAWYPKNACQSSSQGMGDRCYSGGANTSGSREFLQGGSLGVWSSAGSACLYCGNWLGGAYWGCGGCD